MEVTDIQYKKSEIGVIPVDWEVKQLSTIGKFTKGQGIRKEEATIGEIPCIRYGELYTSHNDYIKEYFSFISKETAKTARRLKPGDILFAGSGETKEEIGKCAAFIDNIEAYAGGDIVILSPVDVSPVFLGYLLNAQKIQKQKASKGQGDAIVHISANQLGSIQIPLPPTKSEQTAIATALSDTDALIENLEKLIAKKRNIKQGVMQELLTGRKRLAGFNGEWMKIKLGDICDIRKGQLITEKTAAGGEFPVIAGGINPSYFHNRPNRGKNTITISASGANAGFVSFHRNPIFASDCSTIEEKGTFNIVYIFFLLQLFQKKIFKLQTGGAQPHVYPEHLKPLELVFPQEVTEQDAIANILIDIDEELSGLEKQMNKYQLIKQGMMQTLLTGKIRLV